MIFWSLLLEFIFGRLKNIGNKFSVILGNKLNSLSQNCAGGHLKCTKIIILWSKNSCERVWSRYAAFLDVLKLYCLMLKFLLERSKKKCILHTIKHNWLTSKIRVKLPIKLCKYITTAQQFVHNKKKITHN